MVIDGMPTVTLKWVLFGPHLTDVETEVKKG